MSRLALTFFGIWGCCVECVNGGAVAGNVVSLGPTITYSWPRVAVATRPKQTPTDLATRAVAAICAATPVRLCRTRTPVFYCGDTGTRTVMMTGTSARPGVRFPVIQTQYKYTTDSTNTCIGMACHMSHFFTITSKLPLGPWPHQPHTSFAVSREQEHLDISNFAAIPQYSEEVLLLILHYCTTVVGPSYSSTVMRGAVHCIVREAMVRTNVMAVQELSALHLL